MRVYLDQIGCRLNYSEMETLAARLAAAGHTPVAAPEQAQVIVFNSCAVTTDAARRSRQRVRQLHRSSPDARIALTGCWATLERTQAAALPGVSMVVENTRKDLLYTLLEPWSADLDDPDDLLRMEPEGSPFPAGDVESAERESRTRAFIKVQDGCNNRCTFCIVTVARGVSRSRTLASIVDEVQTLVDSGVQEAVLTGVHLGSYGRDLAHVEGGNDRGDLRRLVEALLMHTDIARLRLSSLEPWELAEGFFDLWQRFPDRLCPHLHLPLQAGTDRQLRSMARRCTTESFRNLVAEARAAIPDVILTTDLIVGFPGETEQDFAQGLAFVEEMRFAHAHIFPFSARPGTAAARFATQVDKATKKDRGRRAHEVVERTGRAERLRFVGAQRPVLWESAADDLTDTSDRLWSGFTDNYLRVTVLAPAHVDLHNRITPVYLESLHEDTLFGTLE